MLEQANELYGQSWANCLRVGQYISIEDVTTRSSIQFSFESVSDTISGASVLTSLNSMLIAINFCGSFLKLPEIHRYRYLYQI